MVTDGITEEKLEAGNDGRFEFVTKVCDDSADGVSVVSKRWLVCGGANEEKDGTMEDANKRSLDGQIDGST